MPAEKELDQHDEQVPEKLEAIRSFPTHHNKRNSHSIIIYSQI